MNVAKIESRMMWAGSKPDGTAVFRRGWVAILDTGAVFGDSLVDRGANPSRKRLEPRYTTKAELPQEIAERAEYAARFPARAGGAA